MKSVDRLLKLANQFEKKMRKSAGEEEDKALEIENQKANARNAAQSQIDSFSKGFVESSLDAALNSAPPDDAVILVNFLSKVKLVNGAPVIQIAVKGSSPATEAWAKKSLDQNAYKTKVLEILKTNGVTPPFDQEFKVERKYE